MSSFGHQSSASVRSTETASPARTSGDNSAVAPPVPIPNTAVKRCSPDGSTAIGCARVGRRQNKDPAGFSQWGLCVWHAYSSREHAVLGSRRVDGQARAGSGRANGSERVNRTSPEQSTRFLETRAGVLFIWITSAGPDAPPSAKVCPSNLLLA